MADDAVAGEVLWQKHNCASCHQLYGLGGYLGPDLTNAVSNPAKGEEFVKAYFNSGAGAMPVFNFNEEEQENLLTFLKHVDKTGYYPVKDATFHSDGWVSIEYK